MKGILGVVVLVACMSCRGKESGESPSVFDGGIVIEHQWAIGTPPRVYGLIQYRNAGVPWLSEHWSTARSPALTRIELGSRSLIVRAPAWVVCLRATLLLGALLSVGVFGWWWVGVRDRGEEGT